MLTAKWLKDGSAFTPKELKALASQEQRFIQEDTLLETLSLLELDLDYLGVLKGRPLRSSLDSGYPPLR